MNLQQPVGNMELFSSFFSERAVEIDSQGFTLSPYGFKDIDVEEWITHATKPHISEGFNTVTTVPSKLRAISPSEFTNSVCNPSVTYSHCSGASD